MEEEGVGEDSGGEGGGAAAGGEGADMPPPYAELSCHFRPLESIAEECAVAEAAYHLHKAKMAMIAAHTSKPVRQTDIIAFTVHLEVGGSSASSSCCWPFCYASNTSQKLSLVRFLFSSVFCGLYTCNKVYL